MRQPRTTYCDAGQGLQVNIEFILRIPISDATIRVRGSINGASAAQTGLHHLPRGRHQAVARFINPQTFSEFEKRDITNIILT